MTVPISSSASTLFSILPKDYISESPIHSEESYKNEAIKTFGSELAYTLQKKDGNWKAVITSRDLFLTTYKILQECSEQLHCFSKEIECTTQSNHGIIFEYRPVPKCGYYAKLPYTGFLGHLVTPYGTLEIVLKNDPKNFLESSTKFFANQLQTYYPRYSLTPDAQDMAVLKNPSRGFLYEIKFEDSLPKEILPHEYSRDEISQICTVLHQNYPYLEITPKKYLLRGISGQWL